MSLKTHTQLNLENSEELKVVNLPVKKNKKLVEKMASLEEDQKKKYLERLQKARDYKIKNKDKIKKWQDAHNLKIRSDPLLREKKNKATAESMKKHRDKWRLYDRSRDKIKQNARSKLRRAVFNGKIQRQPCEVCGEPKSHGHHEDYSKPLDVKWLCVKHHVEHHINERSKNK